MSSIEMSLIFEFDILIDNKDLYSGNTIFYQSHINQCLIDPFLALNASHRSSQLNLSDILLEGLKGSSIDRLKDKSNK